MATSRVYVARWRATVSLCVSAYGFAPEIALLILRTV
jgi:hypothetical protein